MAFLLGIKRKIYRRALAEELARASDPTRKVQPVNLNEAKRITLLFPADDADERKVIDKWRDGHKRAGRKIRVLGYFSEDTGATNFNFRSMSAKELSWAGVPEGSLVEELRKEACELLIRLGPVEHPVLDYLATVNKASLKVGPYVPID